MHDAAASEAKRNAVGITASIAQDQAGLLPDLTIGQVAQRIPGFALVPDFRPTNSNAIHRLNHDELITERILY